MRHGRTNIDMVPTIVIEEFWLCVALFTASFPAIMRIAKKFTTSGIHLGNTTLQQSRSRTGDFGHLASRNMRLVPNGSQNSTMILPPVQGTNTVNINASNTRADVESVGSKAESHVGILKRVDFEVSSNRNGI
jgi:hypothetical protein